MPTQTSEPPPAIRTSAARLIPHPGSTPSGIDAIRVDVSSEPQDTLSLRYELSGNLAGLTIPGPGTLARGERLWEHTCLEAFIRGDGMPAYLELNFSPARRWAAYCFRDYREPGDPWTGPAPEIEVVRGRDRLRLLARWHLGASPWLHRARRLDVALSAVIELRQGALAYWALRHPPGRPDFHHADGAILALDLGSSQFTP
ncbi:MAG: DOMON-like domain-containing protein [Betaproteobacteria bacterium]